MTALVWLRRDLRLADHPALEAALSADDEVLPVFCLDTRLLRGRHRSAARTQFLLDCLADLDGGLRERGSGLVLRSGAPEHELPRLAREVKARQVHVSADVGPFARRRDARVGRALADVGAEHCEHPGLFAVDDPGALATAAGAPFSLFSPYHRAWLQIPRRPVIAPPPSLSALPARLRAGRLPRLEELGLRQELESPPRGGERAAREQLDRFLGRAVQHYHERRDVLGTDGTSRLSPYLHFGCLSAREVEHRLGGGAGLGAEGGPGAGADAFRRQLCWRDFYAQVLLHHPHNARSEHQPRYRGTLAWSHARTRFAAWRQGLTGYPLVDAAMRQLLREGWMHNRGRLVAGSFLTKDLGIDWRWGERWFMRLLLDGDEASNNGNWQWIASVGVDPEPPSRRIFNPSRQQARFDSDGTYVRRYVPELARVPQRYLAEPWKMPPEAQAEAGCVVGRDYPAPIVDHGEARRAALARYAAAR
jgi:deoxyribodipyrimidine photo-lyase